MCDRCCVFLLFCPPAVNGGYRRQPPIPYWCATIITDEFFIDLYIIAAKVLFAGLIMVPICVGKDLQDGMRHFIGNSFLFILLFVCLFYFIFLS